MAKLVYEFNTSVQKVIKRKETGDFVVFLLMNIRNIAYSLSFKFIGPTSFGPSSGQNPRRHPSIPWVYTYKDKEYLLLKR